MVPEWQLLNVVSNFKNVEHLVALSSGNCRMYSTWEHRSTSCIFNLVRVAFMFSIFKNKEIEFNIPSQPP